VRPSDAAADWNENGVFLEGQLDNLTVPPKSPTFLFHTANLRVAVVLAERCELGYGRSMKRYAIEVEDAGTNLAAYVLDLPGCVATGRTKEEVEQRIREAIELHLEGMVEDGLPIPEPSSQVEYVEVDA
jgi:predicted RNase H-like HicB family nuclease